MRSREARCFDMDGTLTEPGQVMDGEMAHLLAGLNDRYLIAIISGGTFAHIIRQCQPFFDRLTEEALIERLMLFPTCGSSGYRYGPRWNEWNKIYEIGFGSGEALRVHAALLESMKLFDYFEIRRRYLTRFGHEDLPASWGAIVDDRGALINFAALGQDAPLEARKNWDPDKRLRLLMTEFLNSRIGDFATVAVGGASSVDVTLRGIDKAFAIKNFMKIANLRTHEMQFVGDAIFPGGNDYPVVSTGVQCHLVSELEETRALLRFWL